MKRLCFLILSLFFISQSLQAASDTWIHELHEEALRHAGLETSTFRTWKKSLRRSALLPRLQMGVDRSLKNDLDIRVQDSISVSSGGVVVGPESTQQLASQNRNFNFEVKIVWFLSDLLFSREDLNISREVRDLARERERLLTQVSQNYFEWLEWDQKIRSIPKPPFQWQMKIAALSANLDMYTGGWFSQNVTRQTPKK